MTFVFDIWYFGGLSSDVKPGQMVRRVIAGEPITLGRKREGSLFALRDICPHRAAPLSSGTIQDDSVECPYHGWRFGTDDGACRISGPPPIDPPAFPFASRKASIDDDLVLNCHVDHAVIGLMDPAHGPYVHRQWWWRSQKSMHEKAKAFEPRERGFAMVAHTPSSNSFAYKLLGGKPVTEISFQLPGIRVEAIKVGRKTLLSFTAVTPINATQTHIRQIFFTDIWVFKILSPILKCFARAFLRQDGHMVDLQQMGLAYDPNLMLVEDADTQAKWYHVIKKEWARAQEEERAFKNPVKARTLRWRS